MPKPKAVRKCGRIGSAERQILWGCQNSFLHEDVVFLCAYVVPTNLTRVGTIPANRDEELSVRAKQYCLSKSALFTNLIKQNALQKFTEGIVNSDRIECRWVYWIRIEAKACNIKIPVRSKNQPIWPIQAIDAACIVYKDTFELQRAWVKSEHLAAIAGTIVGRVWKVRDIKEAVARI